MSVSYDVFLPHVLPYAPNCFEEQARVAIRNACIDFCRETHLLQEDLDPVGAIRGENTYDVDVPSGYVLAQILSLYYVGRRLERKSQLELERLYTRDWQTLAGTPRVFTQFDTTTFTVALTPAEAVANAFTGRIAFMPSRASTVVEDVVFERYLDEIVAGALARLMVTPDQPYTDLRQAAANAARFRTGVSLARAFANGGMNRAPMRVRYQRIW